MAANAAMCKFAAACNWKPGRSGGMWGGCGNPPAPLPEVAWKSNGGGHAPPAAAACAAAALAIR